MFEIKRAIDDLNETLKSIDKTLKAIRARLEGKDPGQKPQGQ